MYYISYYIQYHILYNSIAAFSLLQCSALLMLAMTKDEAEDQEMIANTSYSMQFVYSCSLKVDSDQS